MSPYSIIYFCEACLRWRDRFTGRFVPTPKTEDKQPKAYTPMMAVGIKPLSYRNYSLGESRKHGYWHSTVDEDAYMTDNPEDWLIAMIDGTDIDVTGDFSLPMGELEEWVEFHNSWETDCDTGNHASTDEYGLCTKCGIPMMDMAYDRDTIVHPELLQPEVYSRQEAKRQVKEQRRKVRTPDPRSTLKSINFYRARKGLPPITSLKELN